jgi:hypothetical protein
MRSRSLLERPLLLGELDDLLLDEHALALADGVDVRLGDVGALGQRAEVLELLDRRRNPEWVLVELLVAEEIGEDDSSAKERGRVAWRASSGQTHPEKMSWGLAAPDDRLRISSAKPNDSTTGSRARTVKNDVPSFISSETIRPRRRATTP